MPEETRTDIFRIVVEGREAQAAVEGLQQSFTRMEEAVVRMGEKFDTAVGRMIEPITKLTTSVDALNTSISGMQRNLGDVSAMEAQGRAAQQTTVDYTNLRRAMAEFRVRGGAPGQERYRGPVGGQIRYGREKFVEAYMRGEYAERGFGPGMGAQYPGAGYVPPTMQLQYETAQAAARELGISMEELGARTQKTTTDFAAQSAVIERAATLVDMLRSGIITTAEAEEMLAASSRRSATATREVTQAERERWLAMGRMPPGLGKGVSGTYAPRELRQPAMQEVLRQQMGVRPELGEWTRPAGVEKGVPWEPLKRAEYFGHLEVELEQIQKLETAIGRKLVVQKLMERGSRDVAERFEKQFAVTRSKEEILREISRTGTMTTEMEKELGLQTERTGQSANRAGNMFRYFGRYLLRYLLLWQMIQAVRGTARAWFAAHMEMSDAVADFGWRVSATADDLESYRDRLKDVSTLVGMPVAEIASPLAGRATEAELLRAAEASKVFGGSVEDWLRTLEGSDATLDAFAHGLRISTLATEDYASLIENASGIAKEFNMTEAETIGLLSALPQVIQGDVDDIQSLVEAMASLYEQNQLLMNLGMAPAVTVGPSGLPQRRPMGEVMAEIGRQPIERQRQLAIALGLSREEQQKFLDAAAGWAEVERAMRSTVTASGDMADALERVGDLSASVDTLKVSVSSLLESFGTAGWITDWVDAATFAFQGLQQVIEDVNDQLGGMGGILATLPFVGPGIASAAAAAEWFAERQRGERAARRTEVLGPGAPGGFTGVTPGTEAAAAGPGAWQGFQVMRLGAGMELGRLQQEVNRLTEEFAKPYQDAMGNWVQLTQEEIDSNTQLILALDEHGTIIGTLTAYTPALQQAQENLRQELESQRFNLERLRDITPQQFDTAMQTILPTWEARLGAIPGFEEERELHTFFVGEQDILRQQLATQTGMAYTLQDILDTEKDQLEGMWNIPSGVTMRVPLTSLDLMRWMRGAGGGEMPTDMMLGPGTPGGALETAATAQDNAAMAMQASAGAQAAAAVSMGQLKTQLVGAGIYGGVPVEPGVARAEAEMGELPPEYIPGTGGHGRRGRPGGRPFREVPATPIGTTGIGALTPLAANIVINLVSTLVADGKKLAEITQTQTARQIVNAARATGAATPVRP